MKKLIVFVRAHSGLILVLIFTTFLLSLFFVKDLNVEAFPDPSPPLVEIVTTSEGKSAEEIERRITIPIEITLSGMKGLERVNSVSLYGLSDIKCVFSYSTLYKEARQEVINRLTNLSLPDGAQPSLIPSMMGEVMRYALYGSNNLMELRTIQDWTVTRHLKTAQGVEDVSSYGGYIKAYIVKVQPDNLIKYGLTLSQVMDALSKSNTNVGGRTIELGDQYYMLRGIGLIKNLEDIENNVVSYKNGKAIRIKNVAQVAIENIHRTGIVMHNHNDDVVMGVVLLRRDEKSIPSIKSIHEKIKELNDTILPKGIKIVPFYERWGLITQVIKKVIETAGSGVLLVAIALFLFLGNWRAAVITALVIPISLSITLALMAMLGDSANLLSIGAIDFGIIANIALVMMENYVRISRKNDPKYGPRYRMMTKAIGEVGPPIILLVLIIVLAFIPIFTMKGAEKQIFSPMAKTYSYALLFTLILTFTYLIASINLFLRNYDGKDFGFINIINNLYERLIGSLLTKFRLVLFVGAFIIISGIMIGFYTLGTQFLPNMDEGNIFVRATFPSSISLSKSHENAKEIRDVLLEFPEVTTVEGSVGRPEDGTDPTGPFNSEFYVGLKPYDQWKKGYFKEQLEEDIRKKLDALFPNAMISLSQYIQDQLDEVAYGVKGENAIKLFGEDLQKLDQLANEAKAKIERVPGIDEVGIFKELGQPNFIIEIDRETTSALGLSVQEVLDMISAALGGKEVSQIIEGEKNFSLQVRFPNQYLRQPEKIPGIPIILPNGGMVPLSRLAKIRYDTGASFIYRENHKRYIPIKFSVTSKSLGDTVQKAQNEVSKIPFPAGYYTVWSGIFNQMKEAFQRFYLSIPLSIFLIIILLYVYYGNMRNVMLTLVAPVCTVFGGVVSLLLTGQPLSISAIVGFISIVGVSAFDTCIVINHYMEIYRETNSMEQATLETSREKFRSILMVGLVASLGLLPAALSHGVGSQVQKPLAIVVVGGMLIGTSLILVLMPLLFRFVRVDEMDREEESLG